MNIGVTVPDLIRFGAMAPLHVDPVDAVMGEDWAHLDLGRATLNGGRGMAARRGVLVCSASGRRSAACSRQIRNRW